jgi:acetyl esterase/lipase
MRYRWFPLLTVIAVCAVAAPRFCGQEAAKPAAGKDAKEERPSQAAVLAKSTVVRADQAYGPDDKQRLDVYTPQGAKGAPVVMFVHGGEWTKGDKADVSFKPKFLNENGIVFVSINYRLSPAVQHPAHVRDVAAAVRWVRDHANEFGAAPDKIVLMGHSAGCHLVTLAALVPRYLAAVELRPTDLRGVVAWSGGMYDLVDRVKGTGNYPKYIRQAFGDTEPAWRDASPIAHVGDAAMPPFLFTVVDSRDEKEKQANPAPLPAEQLAARIRQAKGQADVRFLTGRTHFMANHLVGAPEDTTGQILLDFVRRVTK